MVVRPVLLVASKQLVGKGLLASLQLPVLLLQEVDELGLLRDGAFVPCNLEILLMLLASQQVDMECWTYGNRLRFTHYREFYLKLCRPACFFITTQFNVETPPMTEK